MNPVDLKNGGIKCQHWSKDLFILYYQMSVSAIITAHNSQFLSRNVTGLGNVLFQVSAAYSLAQKTGRPFSAKQLRLFGEKLKHEYGFPHLDTIFKKVLLASREDSEDTPVIHLHEAAGCNRTFLPSIQEATECTSKETSVILCGHFESTRYFSEFRDEIRTFFSPPPDVIDSFLRTYPELQSASEVVVSVHFRSPPGHEGIHYLQSREYYARAIEMMKTSYTCPIFFIFKDADASFDESLFSGCRFKVVHNEYDFMDLWLLTLIQNHITSYSTFNFWGAYLAGPKAFVIANKALGFSMYSEARFLEI